MSQEEGEGGLKCVKNLFKSRMVFSKPTPETQFTTKPTAKVCK